MAYEKPRKNSKDERATQRLDYCKHFNAPEEIINAAYDAMQYYMAAIDLRRAAYGNRNGYALKLKAARQVRLGDKKAAIAQVWIDKNQGELEAKRAA